MAETVQKARRAVDRALAFEWSIYVSLARWVTRRPDIGEPGAEPFGYARLAAPVMWLWIGGSAVEVVVAHVLIPWPVVRVAALILGVWGLLWMIGFLASMRVYPHLLDGDVLRVRHGRRVEVVVPWELIDRVAVRERGVESSVKRVQTQETKAGTHLQVAVSGQVNVHVTVCRPVTVELSTGPVTFVELSIWADDPRELAARVRALAA